MQVNYVGLSIAKKGLMASLVLALPLIWYKPESQASLNTPDFVSPAKARFVSVTSQCLLGSGFLTGYREDGKAEVVTAYHLLRCGHGKDIRLSNVVRVDGLKAEIHGADPQRDLLRLLVSLPTIAPQIAIRTKPRLGEHVFTVGSNPQGDRAVVVWGSVFITPPGEVTAKVQIAPGTSGGLLVSANDGALLGMPVREDFGFANAVSGKVLLQFLERTRGQQTSNLARQQTASVY